MATELDLGRGWHMDKRLSVGHIITTIVVGASALLYITSVEKRVSLLEAGVENQKARFEQVITHMTRQYDQITNQLIRIEAKLDTKADKR